MAHPSKPKGTGFELEVVKVLQGYAIEAVKIPLPGSVAGFAGDIACSTFTTSSSKPLPFRFDGCATSISRTEAAGLFGIGL